MIRRMITAVLMTWGICNGQSAARSASDKELAFQDVSIKQIKPDVLRGYVRSASDGVICVNTSLIYQIGYAYGVEPEEIHGLPDWAKNNRYDISYKVAAQDIETYQLHPAEKQLMMQAALEKRLKLDVKFGSKEVPMYQLVIAKGGPKLHVARIGDNYADGMRGPDGTPVTGSGTWYSQGMFTGQRVTISALTGTLKVLTGRDVIDKTGLVADYDISLRWTAEFNPSSPTSASVADAGTSIFNALENQLGLKLEPIVGEIKTLTIKHIEPPSEN
jgi:uncharacterized protein (TIGR03435 family)